MPKRLPTRVRSGLKRLGKDLRIARKRRRLKTKTVAERAGISRPTLMKIEQGEPTVSIGSYAAVAFAVGFETDWMTFANIANDPLGQMLDEEQLPKRIR